jgi:acyl-coenzyme A synthetase/AMP-(fatty) acid ligase
MPGVEECAVDGVDDPVAGQVPRAFIVTAAGVELSERDVLRHCREQLAAWKIPRQIEMVHALPKTGSGKIQRHRLADMAINNQRKQSEGHA